MGARNDEFICRFGGNGTRIHLHQGDTTCGGLGAEISGVNLANLDDASFEEIHRAWLDYHVIYVRRQEMTPEDHLAFARRWGDIHIHPFNAPMDGYPEILQLLKTEDSWRNNGNLWHSDQMYTAQPAKATILIAREMPPFGGDTMFTNQYLAYETLSDGMKEMVGNLKGVNDGNSRKNFRGKTRRSSPNRGKPQRRRKTIRMSKPSPSTCSSARTRKRAAKRSISARTRCGSTE